MAALQRRYDSLQFSCTDQSSDFRRLNHDLSTAIRTEYKNMDMKLDEFHEYIDKTGTIDGVDFNTKEPGRIVITFRRQGILSRPGKELFHLSLFTKGDRFGGLHASIPDNIPNRKKTPRHIYLTNEHILSCCGKGDGEKYIISNFLRTLAYYFLNRQRINGSALDGNTVDFMNICDNNEIADKQIIYNLLNTLASRYERWSPSGRGGKSASIKTVLYFVKIKKIKYINKNLRKNKIENKKKIEKNNKQIDELKIKIKKQKTKEKLKKQKLKKQKENLKNKKSTYRKKSKK